MNAEECNLILARGFDRALTVVLEALAREGFEIDLADAGNLHRPADANNRRRFALLDATLMDPSCGAVSGSPASEGCVCRVSMFELAGCCTLVTMESAGDCGLPMTTQRQRMAERIRAVIRGLSPAGTLNAATPLAS